MVDFRKHMNRKKWEPRIDLNPSSAERWGTCTASPHFIMEHAEKISSGDNVFSEEGTTAHEVAAATLQERAPRTDDKYCCPTPVDGDMRWHAWNYAEYVLEQCEPGGVLKIEHKFPLSYMPERNALIDAGIINPGSLHIVDYKYGAGIPVAAEYNLQLAIYARSLGGAHRNLPNSFPVFAHVYQPRGRNASEPHQVWRSTWGEILELTSELGETAKRILKGKEGLTFAPSPKACQWCPAKGFCAERQRAATKDVEALATINNGPKHLPPVKSISVAQLAAILTHKQEIEKWLKDAAGYALEHMSAGNKIPGFKLVIGRGGNRHWTDPKKAAALLLKTHLRREEVIEECVISPTEAEKLLGKDKFDVHLTNLVARSPGAPTIAPDSDPRESALPDASGFTNLDD